MVPRAHGDGPGPVHRDPRRRIARTPVPEADRHLRRPVLLLVMAALLLVAGCAHPLAARPADAGPLTLSTAGRSSSPVPGPYGSSPSPRSWRVVALGDSVTSGGPCGCATFPSIYAHKLSYARGVPTTASNLGVNGEDSAGLLAALRDPHSAEHAAVGTGDIDLVTIGANDFAANHGDVTAGRCLGNGDTACVQQELVSMERNLEAIVATIHQLRGAQPTTILVTGYWNVFEDGAVARRAFPDIGVRATKQLTVLVNAGIRRAAMTSGATYVDLSVPFNGPRTGGDPTDLLGPDGDHPNADGQDLIASRLIAAGLPGLSPS